MGHRIQEGNVLSSVWATMLFVDHQHLYLAIFGASVMQAQALQLPEDGGPNSQRWSGMKV